MHGILKSSGATHVVRFNYLFYFKSINVPETFLFSIYDVISLIISISWPNDLLSAVFAACFQAAKK